MGQAQMQSVKENPGVAWAQETLNKHAGELKQIASLTYEQFRDTQDELNKITSTFSDVNGKQLLFKVKKGSEDSIFWKGTVRIRCHKLNSRTGVIESSRVLNLKQYIHLYNEITRQASMATLHTDDRNATIRASVILTEMDSQLAVDTEDNECCICMDRKAEIILACTHNYCEQCIDEWNVNHKTCPVCRATVESTDDTWVLTEKPDTAEMAYETTGYLMGLADRTGKPST